MDDDGTLLDRWRGGDPASGRALVARNFRPLYRFFAGKCDEPDDLVQRTFEALVRGKDRFTGRSTVRTYLYGIARRVLYQHLEDRYRARRFDPDVSSIAQVVTTHATRLARAREHRLLEEALRALPVAQQVLLELHYWEDLDAVALAEVLEASPGAIRVRLHRARAALRERLTALRAAPAHAIETIERMDTWARSVGRTG